MRSASKLYKAFNLEMILERLEPIIRSTIKDEVSNLLTNDFITTIKENIQNLNQDILNDLKYEIRLILQSKTGKPPRTTRQ